MPFVSIFNVGVFKHGCLDARGHFAAGRGLDYGGFFGMLFFCPGKLKGVF
jgi:hypothetical protein